jgi:tellurite resistance protein TerC
VGRRLARLLRDPAALGDSEDASAYLAGYLVEKSLSLDNVFVFLLVFTAFGVPVAERHRLLTYGIVGALVLRLIFIVVGAAVLGAFSWLNFVFAAFLIWTGWRMYRHRHDHDGEQELVEKLSSACRSRPRRRRGASPSARRPARPDHRGRRARRDRDRRPHLRRRLGARDPRDHHRQLHRLRGQRVRAARPAPAVLPGGRARRAPLLPQDRARGLLVFIGVKMALGQIVGKIGPEISLPIILAILAAGVVASLLRDRRQARNPHDGGPSRDGGDPDGEAAPEADDERTVARVG